MARPVIIREIEANAMPPRRSLRLFGRVPGAGGGCSWCGGCGCENEGVGVVSGACCGGSGGGVEDFQGVSQDDQPILLLLVRLVWFVGEGDAGWYTSFESVRRVAVRINGNLEI